VVKEAGAQMCQGGNSGGVVLLVLRQEWIKVLQPQLEICMVRKFVWCGGRGQGGRVRTRAGEGWVWGLVRWQQDLICEGPAEVSGLEGDRHVFFNPGLEFGVLRQRMGGMIRSAAAMGDKVTFGVKRDAHGFSCCAGWWSGFLFGITNATASSVESKTKGDEGGVDGRVHNFGGARGSGESYCSWWSRDGRGLANEGGSG